MGYGALMDIGNTLIAVGMHSRLGLTLAFFSLFARPFSLGLMAVGVSGLLRMRSDGYDGLEALRGIGWKAPWSTAALACGGLSLAGLPVGVGFTWRWALYRTLALSKPGLALLSLLAGAGLVFGLWHALSMLLARPRLPKDRSIISLGPSEGWLTAVVVALAIGGCALSGVFPQVLALPAARLAEAYVYLP